MVRIRGKRDRPVGAAGSRARGAFAGNRPGALEGAVDRRGGGRQPLPCDQAHGRLRRRAAALRGRRRAGRGGVLPAGRRGRRPQRPLERGRPSRATGLLLLQQAADLPGLGPRRVAGGGGAGGAPGGEGPLRQQRLCRGPAFDFRGRQPGRPLGRRRRPQRPGLGQLPEPGDRGRPERAQLGRAGTAGDGQVADDHELGRRGRGAGQDRALRGGEVGRPQGGEAPTGQRARGRRLPGAAQPYRQQAHSAGRAATHDGAGRAPPGGPRRRPGAARGPAEATERLLPGGQRARRRERSLSQRADRQAGARRGPRRAPGRRRRGAGRIGGRRHGSAVRERCRKRACRQQRAAPAPAAPAPSRGRRFLVPRGLPGRRRDGARSPGPGRRGRRASRARVLGEPAPTVPAHRRADRLRELGRVHGVR